MQSQAELHPSHQLRVLERFGREEETILGKKPGGQCPSYLVLLSPTKSSQGALSGGCKPLQDVVVQTGTVWTVCTTGFHQSPEAVVRLFPRKPSAPQRDSRNGKQQVPAAPSPERLPCATRGWEHLGSALSCGWDSSSPAPAEVGEQP